RLEPRAPRDEIRPRRHEHDTTGPRRRHHFARTSIHVSAYASAFFTGPGDISLVSPDPGGCLAGNRLLWVDQCPHHSGVGRSLERVEPETRERGPDVDHRARTWPRSGPLSRP